MAVKPKQNRPESGFKDTIESIVITFLVAFMFRAYVVEAFEIPTGSMAPTLYGRHMDMRCDQCGYRFATEVPDKAGNATCPMCHHQLAIRVGQPDSAGDRIVVQKYLYSISEPRRWDVVVFKNPENPSINFIKRLVGLPNEAVWAIDGNIYTRAGSDQNAPWRIQRKSERPEVQNAVWQPIYHSAYVPLDRGSDGFDREEHPWSCPWRGTGAWDLTSRSGYLLSAEPDGAIRGSLKFGFDVFTRGMSDWYSYSGQFGNTAWRHRVRESEQGGAGRMGEMVGDPIEDVRVAATVMLLGERTQGGKLEVVLSTTARLDDMMTAVASDKNPSLSNAHRIEAKYMEDGTVTIARVDAGASVTLATGNAPALEQGGIGRRLELWYVDEEASVWVDGKRVAMHRFDGPAPGGGWPAGQLIARAPAENYPDIAIDVRGRGTGVKLVNVDVDRDLFYVGKNARGTSAMRGALMRHDLRSDGPMAEGGVEGQPVELEADQFWCLGDNSPWSHDGRAWTTVDPWIETRMLHDNLQRVGVVPRRLMMGRAFFVYFPAPHRLKVLGAELMIVPNFGEMRMIH